MGNNASTTTRNFLTQLDVVAMTDIGKKRQRNEDSVKMVIPPPGTRQEVYGGLFMVADGMGGLGGGDVASQFAIDEFIRRYYGGDTLEQDLTTRFRLSLESANARVREQAPRLGLPRIGSTASGVILSPQGQALIFNVGDCRVYRIRGDKISRVSRDQSVTEKQIEAGMITEEDAKITRSSMVTAFLGQPIPIEANVALEQAQADDVYVICSDGLWGLVNAPPP